MKTIPVTATPPTTPFPGISAGDTVEVETRDGRRTRFVVLQVDGDTLVSEDGERHSRDQIVQVKRRSFSGWKTGLLVGAGVYGVVYTFLALMFTGAL